MLKNVQIKYRIEISAYYKSGMLLSSSLEAPTKKKLIDAQKAFIKKNKADMEVICFYGFCKITYDRSDKSMNRFIKFVKKVTNSYAPKNL
jgi:hypothetical protein